jgi:hypothetical protein
MAANPPAPGASRKISFNVSDQYDIQDVIGEGAYGVVWYVYSVAAVDYLLTNNIQLCFPQTIRPKSRNQENYTIRPLHVLPSHSSRDEALAILQP